MNTLQLVYEYLRECGVFYVGTASGGRPAVRPMSEVCLWEGNLYFALDKKRPMYLEILSNNHVCIAARHPDHSWITISGRFVEDDNRDARAAMIEAHQESLGSVYDPDDGRLVVEALLGGSGVLRNIDGKEKELDLQD